MSTVTPASPDATRSPVDLRQIGIITAVAIGVFVGFRYLPIGTNLSHMDFRVDAKNAIEFCDPLNPQFIPVIAARSPITMALRTATPPTMGVEQQCVLVMSTTSGKAVAPEDLLVAHTRKLHLLIVDPTLTDYQHVHPEPGKTKGEWEFAFTPKLPGTYRVFADFTPAATSRGLYASVDAEIAGQGIAVPSEREVAARHAAAARSPDHVVEVDGFRYQLTPVTGPIRAGQPAELNFGIVRPAGGPVPLEPVMGAFAHLVAFDEARSGFAHLHPTQIDLTQPPDATHPMLNFKITIPKAGRYVIWAQISLGGQERFVPFWFEVVE